MDSATYNEALVVFRDLCEDTIHEGFTNEYVRGGVNLLADLFAVVEMDAGERMEQVLADLRRIPMFADPANLSIHGVAPYVHDPSQEVTSPLPKGSASWPTIEFADSSGAAAVRGIAAYTEFTVDLDLTNDGYPHERVMIVGVDEDQDVVVCETEEDGTPIRNSTWAIPLEVIKKVTVL